MSWVFAVLLVVVVGAVVVVFLGGGGSMAPAEVDRPEVTVPDGPLTGPDLREVRFNTVVRGYRAVEVDALLERLARQLDAAGREPDDRSAQEPPSVR